MKPPVLLLFHAFVPIAALAVSRPAPVRVFISPSGEPFRPADGVGDGFETWFAQADTDRDGRLDRSEFRADAVRFFKRLDTNFDGVIDGFEVATYEKGVAPELDISGQGFAAGGSSRVEAVALLSDPEPVSGADVNLDSHITISEWLAAADQRFDILDTKHLGHLAHDQLKALLPKPGKRRNR